MRSRLGQKYELGWEIISKTRADYQGEDYLSSGLPAAPAVMIGEEVLKGPEISAEALERAIRRHLRLPPEYLQRKDKTC